MRFIRIALVLLVGMVTQSCKIEMTPLVELMGSFHFHPHGRQGPFFFSTSKAIEKKGGFRDTLIIGDDPASRHGESMKKFLAFGSEIPETSLVFFERFKGIQNTGNIGLRMLTSGAHETLRNATRVVHLPLVSPLRKLDDKPRIEENTMLFVLAAGNVSDSYNGDRDVFNIDHIQYVGTTPSRTARRRESYRNELEIYKTGKVIAVTSARVTEEGVIEPNEYVVQCGDIKESCLTMLPAQPTSSASNRAAGVSFYLAQFWETPEEIVEVLKECAVDIGEPGVDREYGVGAVNLICPRVLKKEIEVVSGYLAGTERGEEFTGGDLDGLWSAENIALQVYIPQALRETVQADLQGTVTGTVEFTEGTVTADFAAKAAITAAFLSIQPIEVTAEDRVQLTGSYTADQNTVNLSSEKSFTYTATRDSLHLGENIFPE